MNQIVLVHPVVEITRDENGRFSFADILEHLKRRPQTPMSPKTEAWLKRARIDRVAVENGVLSLVDRAAPGGTGLLFIDRLDAALEHVALGAPASFSLDMGFLSRTPNFELEGRTGPLPETLEMKTIPELVEAHLKIDDVPLRALRLWLPAGSTVDVINSELSADVELTKKGALGGRATIADLVVSGSSPEKAELVLDGALTPGTLDLSRARATFGDAAVWGQGRVELPRAGRPGSLAITFRSDRIDLAKLGIAVKPASLSINGRLSGPTSDPAEQVVEVQDLRLKAGDLAVTGSGAIDGLSRPRIRFELRSPDLDVDALRATFPGTREGSGSKGATSSQVTVDGHLAAAKGRMAGIPFTDLNAHVVVKDGKATIELAHVDTYGGRLIADGTRVDFGADPIGYRVALRFAGVDAAGLFSGATALGRTLDGELDAKIDLSGRGGDWSQLAPTLTGRIDGSLAHGRFRGVNLVRAVAEPLAEALPIIERATGVRLPAGTDTQFEELSAVFRVDGGMLRLQQPMTVKTDAGTITFTGAIGLDRRLDLTGRFELTPQLIETITGGKLTPASAVPVGLQLGCTLLAPCVSGVDVKEAVAALATGEAKRTLKQVLGL